MKGDVAKLNTPKWGILAKPVVPINLHPKFDSVLADEGLYGMIVKIIEDKGDGWYRVETHYDYGGYIHKSNMVTDETMVEKWETKADKIIYGSLADVLPEPKFQGYIITTLTRGASIIVTGEKKESWTEVLMADNTKGWVRTEFIGPKILSYDVKQEESLRKSIVDAAMAYMGTQYRWGGKSPLGIDCSGLCSISYLLNGIIIYRDAQRKDQYMKQISKEEMKPGDLIFFPGHVAMYMGDDKYVHSSSNNNGVDVNSLNPKDKNYNDYLAKNITDIGTIF